MERPGTGDEMERLAETLNGMLARLEAAFTQSVASRPTRPTSCGRRSPRSAAGSRWPCGPSARPRSTGSVLGSSLVEVERLIRLAEDLLLLSRSSAGPE